MAPEKNFSYLPIHELVTTRGPEKTEGLLYFHAFTGCDSVSGFHGLGKKTAGRAWDQSSNVSNVFKRLSTAPTDISDENFSEIQKFTIKMYDKHCVCESVTCQKGTICTKRECHRPHSANSKRLIVPRQKSGIPSWIHLASLLNVNSLLPSPLEWEWQTSENGLHPLWTSNPEAVKACQELIKCSCNKGCQTGRCRCLKFNLCGGCGHS